MKRYRGLLVRLVLPAFVLLTVFWLGPWLQLRALEGKLPRSPLVDAREGDWAVYKVTRRGLPGPQEPFVRCYRIESVTPDRVAFVSTAAIGPVGSMALERSFSFRSTKDPWLLQLFPTLKIAKWPDAQTQLEPRTELERTFMSLKIRAKTAEEPGAEATTYWLSDGVRCTGWVARSVQYQNGGNMDEELRGYGRQGTLEWGSPPESALVR